MDNLVFEESVNAEIDQSEFISKKWIYVNDSNSQNYTSQVVIDSTPLANSGGWINWAEGYIVMPLVVQLSTTTTANLPIGTDCADHSWAFKSGFWHMINSMTLEFNNQNVVQQTPFLNVFRSFKAMTSFSQDDLFTEGATLGFYPDNPSSWTFAAGAAGIAGGSAENLANGVGLCNNRAVPTLFAQSPVAGASITTASLFPITNGIAGASNTAVSSGATNPSPYYGEPEGGYNQGFAKRQGWFGYDPQNDQMGQALINDAIVANTVYRPVKLTQSAAGTINWSVVAKLRLKDLSDFFLKCPLLKGSTIRFYINTNQTSITFAKTDLVFSAAGAITTQPTISASAVSVLGGLTNPLMISSAGLGQGSAPLPADTYTLSINIQKSDTGVQTALKSCRLYAPVYKMNPLAEQRYLQLAPTKKIDYCDIFQYQFSGIGVGDTFNILVSNGITDIQSVLVVPFLAANGGTTYNTLLSPFSTSGATPDPITLFNFNILVSGMNLFLNNEYYDYEQFNQELKSSNQLNGSLTTGLASGLIGEDMFSRGMRYYYGNCSRVLPSEVGVSRSVQIQGQNVSKVACNLMVFVEFKRSITIDISTGARIE